MYLSVKKEGFHQYLLDCNTIAPVNKDIVRYLPVKDTFVFELPLYSPKEYFQPEGEVLIEFDGNSINTPKLNNEIRIFLMPRCDVNALDKVDKLRWDDKLYKEKRDKSVIIEIPCKEDEKCFCNEVGLKDCYDIKLFEEKNNTYTLHVRTKKGKKFIESYREKRPGKDRFTIKNETNLKENEMVFEKHAQDCLGCTACTIVCPTCYCFHVEDQNNMGGVKGKRARKASSCLLSDFTKVAGGYVFRETRGKRLRQRVLHKFYYYKKRFGEYMCVGCGRCRRTCPSGIDFYKIWRGLNG